MKKKFYLIALFLLAFAINVNAQKPFVIIGTLDQPVYNKKVWVDVSNLYDPNCDFQDSLLTDSAGSFVYTFASSCHFLKMDFSMINCEGNPISKKLYYALDTIKPDTTGTDTLYLNVDYCPGCAGFKADFIYRTVYTSFITINTSNGKATDYFWRETNGPTFGANSKASGLNNTYGNYGPVEICLFAKDTINKCSDSACKTITLAPPSAPRYVTLAVAVGKTANTKAFIEYRGQVTDSCVFNDSVQFNGDTLFYQLPVTPCLWADVGISIVNCGGQKTGTYIKYDYFTSPDTILIDIPYCDSCSAFKADFTYTISGKTATITNTSSANSNKYYFNFEVGGGLSYVKNPSFTYYSKGMYNVRCDAYDTVYGCYASVQKTINIGNVSKLSISGQPFKGSYVYNEPCKVWLIQVQVDTVANDTLLIAIDSTQIQGEPYKFYDLPQGDYLIKVAPLPSATDYNTVLPTYRFSSQSWRTAGKTTLTTFTYYNHNLLMIQATNPGGPGFIGGYASQGANKTGDPLEALEVQLYTAADVPVAVAYTDANGEYKFNNIAYDNYKVRVEVLGKPSEEFLTTLDAANPTATNGNFEVNTKDIKVKKSTGPGVGIAPIAKNGLAVYPNPASTTITIEPTNSAIEITLITIYNTLGAQVLTAHNSTTIDVSALQNGVYIITAFDGKNYITNRFTINK